MRDSWYQTKVKSLTQVDSRYVEAWMLVGTGGTLDHLSPEQFAQEVRVAAALAKASSAEANEMLAETYGLSERGKSPGTAE